jgi:NADPH:quinone reductase
MKAWCTSRLGEPGDVLQLEELPEPRLPPGHVLVEIHATGLSYADVLMCRGTYQFATAFPYVPGGESTGIVRAVADDASHGHLVGQTVLAMGGGLAERAAVACESIYPIPAETDLVTLAALPVNYATVAFALTNVLCMAPGEWALVLGASGGVGSAAVDMVGLLGGQAIAVAGGSAKADACRRQDRAAIVIDYQETPSIRSAVLDATNGAGVAVCIDPVGGAAADEARRCVQWGGTYVTVGFASGTIPDIPLNHILMKGYKVAGANWGGFILRHPDRVRPSVEKVIENYAYGRLRPLVTEYGFDQAAVALGDHADRRSIGKVVVSLG